MVSGWEFGDCVFQIWPKGDPDGEPLIYELHGPVIWRHEVVVPVVEIPPQDIPITWSMNLTMESADRKFKQLLEFFAPAPVYSRRWWAGVWASMRSEFVSAVRGAAR